MVKYMRLSLVVVLTLVSQLSFAIGNDYFVSPVRLTLAYKPMLYGKLLLSSSTSKRLLIAPTVDQNHNALESPEKVNYDLSPYMKVMPSKVRLAPNATRPIRYQIKLPSHVPDGTYYAYVKFVMLSAPQSGFTAGGDKAKFGVTPMFNMQIPVYVNKGMPAKNPDFNVSCKEVSKDRYEVDYDNKTKWHFIFALSSKQIEKNFGVQSIPPYSHGKITLPVDDKGKSIPDIKWTLIFNEKPFGEEHTLKCVSG